MSETYEARLIAGLKAMGGSVDQSDRSKYTAFIVPFFTDKTLKVFVGRAGAFRVGQCASRSWSHGDPSHKSALYAKVLAAGDAALAAAQGKVGVEEYT